MAIYAPQSSSLSATCLEPRRAEGVKKSRIRANAIRLGANVKVTNKDSHKYKFEKNASTFEDQGPIINCGSKGSFLSDSPMCIQSLPYLRVPEKNGKYVKHNIAKASVKECKFIGSDGNVYNTSDLDHYESSSVFDNVNHRYTYWDGSHHTIDLYHKNNENNSNSDNYNNNYNNNINNNNNANNSRSGKKNSIIIGKNSTNNRNKDINKTNNENDNNINNNNNSNSNNSNSNNNSFRNSNSNDSNNDNNDIDNITRNEVSPIYQSFSDENLKKIKQELLDDFQMDNSRLQSSKNQINVSSTRLIANRDSSRTSSHDQLSTGLKGKKDARDLNDFGLISSVNLNGKDKRSRISPIATTYSNNDVSANYTGSNTTKINLPIHTEAFRTIQITCKLKRAFGMKVYKNQNALLVLSIIEDSPAHRSGLQCFDQILEVNGECSLNWSSDRFVCELARSTSTILKVQSCADTTKCLMIKPKVKDLLDIDIMNGTITNLDNDSSAYKCGLRNGQIVLSVSNKNVYENSDDDILKKIRKRSSRNTNICITTL
eukprot:Awhi_evm1s4454